MPLLYQIRHEAVDEGQQQGADMGTVHVRICHQNDFIIPKLGYIEILMYSCTKCRYHGPDFRVCVYLVQPGLFHVQNLSPQGKYGLSGPGPGCLCAASGGIPLHDVDFTVLGILVRAVRQLSGKSHAV